MTPARAEEARAILLELCPEGFEEGVEGGDIELVAYVGASREAQIRRAFGSAEAEEVAPGWESAWRDFHRPVRVGPLWVGPPWLTPDPDALPVVVDPGQAFGTGAHATTRLCLELLVDRKREGVLDAGCGSGVLAIAAAVLGFAPVAACDREPEAVAAARRNAAANRVRIDVSRADVLADDLPRAPLVLANIERGVVEVIARRVEARLLIASGYLAGDEPALPGWILLDRREHEGWGAGLFQRSP